MQISKNASAAIIALVVVVVAVAAYLLNRSSVPTGVTANVANQGSQMAASRNAMFQQFKSGQMGRMRPSGSSAAAH